MNNRKDNNYFYKSNNETMADLRTPYAIKKEKRDRDIYRDYLKMMKEPGAAATVVRSRLCEKYGIASPSTIWLICKTMAKAEKNS